MIYVTGDTHRDFSRIERFCQEHDTSTKDIMIILGDAAINYIGYSLDNDFKIGLSELPITLFCIHGNHERRPKQDDGYIVKKFHGGCVYVEKRFPNIVFAKDGEVYDFEGQSCMVCGGAYSVDKYYRLAKGYLWFDDEQPDETIKATVENRLNELNGKVDIMLTHTCPIQYMPSEAFLSGVNQSTVDSSTEEWLGKIEAQTQYDVWYCGHFHINKAVNKMRFLYDSIVAISSSSGASKNEESVGKSND